MEAQADKSLYNSEFLKIIKYGYGGFFRLITDYGAKDKGMA